ncbi:uncharacterized protein BCR38DRAFT_335181 [Pseudomassariella vexata]|uniref:Delta(24)-sterol reductase n=1 Tax=Pseudomassariella vexata TaxID=1141098 RepID=A0A1Y2EB40_9PEZI|nr:uncharacterized protein BCR38DRAFT_335181 [Pseudomassariella vexata]ORY68514.1 hypothetical protein BCR38DRAFT_335181 [Pseudomassariella vexata]
MEEHDSVVAVIAERVQQFHRDQKPFRCYHGSTNSTRTSNRRVDNTVDTSKLANVLTIDTNNKTALVEPNVPMDALVDATLKAQLIPLVVMEFPGITVGGGFSGSAGESSSFRHGPFDSIINWIEIVIPSGDVMRASKTQHTDLFWGAASGFGTLGVVTLLEVQLKEAKKYVDISYVRAKSLRTATDGMAKLVEEEVKRPGSIDFIDGIVFSPSFAVVMAGRLVDELPHGQTPVTFTKRNDLWFYLHVKQKMKHVAGELNDFIPLVDYLFRYDRGGFWVARYAFRYFCTPFKTITRSWLDRFMHTRVMYHALHQSKLAEQYIIQDVGVPEDKVADICMWLYENLRTYPLWLCPLRVRRDSPDSAHGLHAGFGNTETQPYLINFGVWRPGSRNREKFIRQNRELENKVHELGGKKWLYAYAYYTEEEFWNIYDRASYDALRAKYSATYLPSVYDKVKVDLGSNGRATRPCWGIRPFQGLYGVWRACWGGDYLLAKTGTTPRAPKNE